MASQLAPFSGNRKQSVKRCFGDHTSLAALGGRLMIQADISSSKISSLN